MPIRHEIASSNKQLVSGIVTFRISGLLLKNNQAGLPWATSVKYLVRENFFSESHKRFRGAVLVTNTDKIELAVVLLLAVKYLAATALANFSQVLA